MVEASPQKKLAMVKPEAEIANGRHGSFFNFAPFSRSDGLEY